MKLIDKANNTTEKIISSDDIIMLQNNENTGNSLTEVIDNQQEDINNLKSNVKWLYKYGGVGGRGGSGGGGSSTKYGVVAYLDSIKIGKDMIIDKTKYNHQLFIQISKPGGRTYYCTYKVEGSEDFSRAQIISGENNYKLTISNLKLTKNSIISIDVWDDENGEHIYIDGNYIVDPYKISVNLIDNYENIYSFTNSNDVYIGDAKNTGFIYRLSYNISINAEIKYELSIVSDNNYANNVIEGIIRKGTIEDKINNIDINLNDLLDDNYAGQYIINTKITIIQDGETYDNYQNLFYLIPKNLYLAISTSNNDILYNVPFDDINDDSIHFLNSGYQTLYIKPYNGNNLTSNILISAVKINSVNEQPVTLFSDILVKSRNTYQYPIYLSSTNKTKYQIDFTATYNDQTYSITKYIYVKANDNTLIWYNTLPNPCLSYKLSEVTTISYTGPTLPIQSYNAKYSIDVSSNIKNSINLFNTDFTTESNTVILNIGIQYNFVNDSNINIITISNTNTVGSINIYQDKIVLGNGSSIDIYIPREKNFNKLDPEKYHLLTLVSRPINSTQAEFICYIDGIIEQAFKEPYGLGSSSILTGNISCNLNKGNYSINLFELGYYKNFDATFNDADVANYYNTYRHENSYGVTDENIINSQLAVLNVAKKFTINNYGLVEIQDTSDISTISKNTNIPVLILEYNKTFFDDRQNVDFYSWFLTQYDEEFVDPDSPVNLDVPVEVYYLNNQEYDEDLKVTYTDAQGNKSNVPFYITIQGSSTRHFTIKNLDLTINLKDGDDEYVYTPKFIPPSTTSSQEEEKRKKKMFLPEKTFTLKADMSDSSHCNNTSIGEFVNDNTQQFDDALNDIIDPYKGYIKNCLLGFPVILIIKEFDGIDYRNSKFYYIGIYNFNLGRKSEFNLGYKPIQSDFFKDNKNNSPSSDIKLYKINIAEHSQLKPSLCVAEIQGNENTFDFSQFDNSLLFGNNSFGVVDSVRMYDDIVYGGNDMQKAYESIAKFTRGVAYLGGYIFKFIGKHFGSDEDQTHGYNDGYTAHEPGNIEKSINQVPNFQWQGIKVKDSDGTVVTSFVNKLYLDENDSSININNKSINDPNFKWNQYAKTIIADFYMGKIKSDDEEQVRNSDNRGVDLQSLVEYYTICMGFGLTDSVFKNLNIKTWTMNNIGVDKQDKYYIAFYDMDTALGRSNKGSKTKYFAFSDYYYTEQVEQNGLIVSQNNKIYRDFYPKGTSGENKDGFDVPSSYLFGIAKYQALLNAQYSNEINSTINKSNNITPLAIWSTYRQSGGPLESAEEFVKNYFNKNLCNVPPVLLSYNYRSKYLRRDNKSQTLIFDTYNITPLHGTGIHSVVDWLSGRLHILDMYFNVMGLSKPIDTYNNGIWEQVTYGENQTGLYETKTAPLSQLLYKNPDIVILQSMFAQNEENRYVNYPGGKIINPNVKSQYLAPTIIKGAATDLGKSYLFMDESKYMKIDYNVRGDDAVGFFGSVLWTDVSDISDFISKTNDLIINSDYLQNLIMKKPEAMCKTLTLVNIKSVKSIEINGENHEFKLTLPSNAEKLVNLDKIDIHNTKIYIETLKDLNISELNMSGVKLNTTDAKNISILSCNNLSNVDLTGLKCTSLQINPVWSDNIELNNIDCKSIEVTNTRFNNAKIQIRNCENLESLTLVGFEEIIINGCKKLYKLSITESTIINDTSSTEVHLKKLHIIKSNTRNVQSANNEQYTYKKWDLTFNGDDISNSISNSNAPVSNLIDPNNGSIFDLSCFEYLNEINFSDSNIKNTNDATNGFYAVKLPHKSINLTPYCFNCTPLMYIYHDYNENEINNNILDESIDLALIINGPGTFKNTKYNTQCQINSIYIYNYLSYNSSIENLSLEEMFKVDNGGNLSIYMCNRIINGIKNNKIISRNISSLKSMFEGQTGIIYNRNSPSDDTLSSLSEFVNVNSIENIFKGTRVEYIESSLFNDNDKFIGKEVSELNISGFCPSGNIYIESNIFNNIINKLKIIKFNEGTKLIVFKRNNNDIEADPDIAHLFSTNSTPTNIEVLENFDLMNYNNEPINFAYLFVNLGKLTSIKNSFNTESLYYTNINETKLNELQNIRIISNSFNMGVTNNNSDLVKLDEFFNWNIWASNASTLTEIDMFSSNPKTSFNIKKYINFVSGTVDNTIYDWYKFWKILMNFTTLNNIFKNCTLYANGNTNNTNYFELKVKDIDGIAHLEYSRSNVENTMSLFENFVVKSSSTADIIPIKLTKNTFVGLEHIKVYESMFANCAIYGNLPLNLFKKATKTTVNVNSIGIKSLSYTPYMSGSYLLHLYENYTKDIISLKRMFSNITIYGNHYYEYESDGDSNIDLISYLLNNENTDYQSTKFNAYEDANNVSDYLPDYYADMFGLSGDYISEPFKNNGNVHYNVKKNNNNLNKLFVAPDLLYACVEGCDFSGMFQNSVIDTSGDNYGKSKGFEGIMPNNFMSKLPEDISKIYKFENMLTGITIIPNYSYSCEFLCPIYSVNDSNEENFEYIVKTNNIYVFIPEHFNDNIKNFSKLFDFNLIIPEEEKTNGDYNSYYIMHSNSIPNVQSLDTMPSKILNYRGINSWKDEDTISKLNSSDFINQHKIHFNIVFDKEKLDAYIKCDDINTYTKNNEQNETIFDFDKIFDYEGFSKQKIINNKAVNGFNLFDGTNFNNIVNTNISPHLYGYLISPLTINNNLSIGNNNKILTAGGGTNDYNYSDLSCFALFNNNDDNKQLYRTYLSFLNNSGNPITINSWQGIKYYKNKDTNILSDSTWGDENVNQELKDLHIRLKEYQNNNIYINDIYRYQNSFETVMNIPYNDSIIDTMIDENGKIILKVKATT